MSIKPRFNELATLGYTMTRLMTDFELIKTLVEDSINGRLIHQRIIESPINVGCEYHLCIDDVAHKGFDKRVRCLSRADVGKIIATNFFIDLQSQFGDIEISDEHYWGYPEIYYRLVRPNRKDDVGPLHRDGDFWSLHPEWKRPAGFGENRLKVWIAIDLQENEGGLMVIPKSHLLNLTCVPEFRVNDIKPVLNSSKELEHELLLLTTNSGSAIIFNDSLVHCGGVSTANKTRISLEFTLHTKLKF